MHLSTISSWSYVLDGRQSVRWFKKSYGLSIRNVFWKCSKRKTASQQIIRSKCSIFQDHQLHPNCWSQKRSSSQLETSQHLPWPILARKYIHYTPNRPWGTRRKSDRKISLISLCSTKINKGQRCIAFKKMSSPKSLKPLALNLLKVGHVLEWLRASARESLRRQAILSSPLVQMSVNDQLRLFADIEWESKLAPARKKRFNSWYTNWPLIKTHPFQLSS